MRTLVCFGDSNTWGYIPGTGSRYPYEVRWTGNLQNRMGSSVRIIEEGLNGRTTVWDEPFRPGRNGRKAIVPVLESHSPVDLLILFLGTNDLKHFYNATAVDSARGMGTLISTARCSSAEVVGNPPDILVISPPPIGPLSLEMAAHFIDAEKKSLSFSTAYGKICEEKQCTLIDSSAVVTSSSRDGIHLEADDHNSLAARVEAEIEKMFANPE